MESEKIITKGDVVVLKGRFIAKCIGITSLGCASFECITSFDPAYMAGQVYTFTINFALSYLDIINTPVNS